MADYDKELRKKYLDLHPKSQVTSGMRFTTDYVEWLEAYAYVLQRELDMLVSTVKDEHQKHNKKLIERLDAGMLDLEDTRVVLTEGSTKDHKFSGDKIPPPPPPPPPPYNGVVMRCHR
jgi:hypothetical protein